MRDIQAMQILLSFSGKTGRKQNRMMTAPRRRLKLKTTNLKKDKMMNCKIRFTCVNLHIVHMHAGLFGLKEFKMCWSMQVSIVMSDFSFQLFLFTEIQQRHSTTAAAAATRTTTATTTTQERKKGSWVTAGKSQDIRCNAGRNKTEAYVYTLISSVRLSTL